LGRGVDSARNRIGKIETKAEIEKKGKSQWQKQNKSGKNSCCQWQKQNKSGKYSCINSTGVENIVAETE
jgi:hypothetical protein